MFVFFCMDFSIDFFWYFWILLLHFVVSWHSLLAWNHILHISQFFQGPGLGCMSFSWMSSLVRRPRRWAAEWCSFQRNRGLQRRPRLRPPGRGQCSGLAGALQASKWRTGEPGGERKVGVCFLEFLRFFMVFLVFFSFYCRFFMVFS